MNSMKKIILMLVIGVQFSGSKMPNWEFLSTGEFIR